jgi:hypothetical protein
MQTIDRMRHREATRALPEALPEWKHIDISSRFWSVRHYDRISAMKDPYSPANGRKSAANWPDSQAIGIVFEFDPERGIGPVVRYLSGNRDALQVVNNSGFFTLEGLKSNIMMSKTGIIDIEITNDNETAPIFLFVLAALFGHGVFV